MDVLEAINKRQSIRGFKPNPVPDDILRKITGGALRSPSASNSQPWELAVVTGAKLEAIKEAYVASAMKLPVMDLPISMQYPEPWSSRRKLVMAGVLEKLGIAREDKQSRTQFGLHGMRLWGAPAVIYVMIDRGFYQFDNTTNIWPVFDCGLITQDIMLLATEYGLGSIPAIQPVMYPEIIRNILGLPDNKIMVIAVPVGYPDPDYGANRFRTSREPFENTVKFYK
jgi:nitroreductase